MQMIPCHQFLDLTSKSWSSLVLDKKYNWHSDLRLSSAASYIKCFKIFFCTSLFAYCFSFLYTVSDNRKAKILSFLKGLAAVILSSPKAKILIKCIVQISSISVCIFLSYFKLPKIIPKVCIYTVCFCITFFIRITSSVKWIDLGQILQSQKMQILTPIYLLFFH